MNLLVTMHENFEIFHCILGGVGFFLDEMLDEYLATKNDELSYLLYIYGWMGKKLMYYSCGFFLVDEHMDEKMDSPIGRRSNNEINCNDA
jgi:hypothetical protein